MRKCITVQVPDWKLFLGVLSLVVVDVVVLTVYTIVEYPKRSDESSIAGLQARRVVNRENPEDIVGVSVIMTCLV